jgi:Flp pilus assembly protein TadD
MGMVLRRMLRTEEAVAAFRRATDLAPTEAPAWRGLALGLDAMGSRTEAISAFEQYLALDPDAPDADDVRARVAQLQAPAPPER